MSEIEKLCIRSFLANGHDFHLYTYQEVEGVPAGTTLQDARTILPEDRIFTYQQGWGKGSVAGFADLFRYHLLHTKGGWWVDTDVVCLRPIDHAADVVICSSFEDHWGENLPNACILKFPKSHAFTQKAVAYCESVDLKNIIYGQVGPHLVQELTKKLELSHYVVPYYAFNPIAWRHVTDYIAFKQNTLRFRAKELLRPFVKPGSMKGRRISEKSYTIHLWNEVWRSNALDKNDSYHKKSLVEKLKKRYA